MATDKPYLKTYVQKEYYNKIIILAEKENRSLSNYLESVIKKHIDQYEQEHGEIQIKNEQ